MLSLIWPGYLGTPYAAEADSELAISCLYLPSAVIIRVCHRAWFAVLGMDPGLPAWD